MGFVERLGEETVKLAGQIYYHTLGFLIRLILALRKLRSRLAEAEVRFIYPIFERRGVEFRDYVVLKAQVSNFLFFLVAVLLIFDFLRWSLALPLLLLAGLASLSMVLGQVKEHFADDYPPYRDFFLAYFSITLLLLLLKLLVPSVDWRYPYVHMLLASVGGVVAFSAYFRRRYSRDYTYGTVVGGGSIARVKVNYDIRAGVKPGVHALPNEVGATKGDRVKLKVERSLFNLRGNRVVEILEVVGAAGQGGA